MVALRWSSESKVVSTENNLFLPEFLDVM